MKTFVSSPVRDMEEKRKIVKESLVALGFPDVFISESDKSQNKSSFEACLQEVQRRDLFILLLGRRYGWIPEGFDRSVTEIEFDKARETGSDIIVFKLDYFDREPEQEKFIKRVGDFTDGRFWGKKIENCDELRRRVFQDIPFHLWAKLRDADKYFAARKSREETEIQFQKCHEIKLQGNDDKNALFLKARIGYPHEAGSWYLMRISVNGQILRAETLINKCFLKKIRDGRECPWFISQNDSWRLCYSPNFKNNYYHPRYKVVSGDPYIFVFDLPNIKKGNRDFEIRIEHVGTTENDAFRNSILISDIRIL